MAMDRLCALILLELTEIVLAVDEISDTDNMTCTTMASPCKEGILIPMWMPQNNLNESEKLFRSLIYIFALIYLFLGVSIVSDKFVTAIDAITSTEKNVSIKLLDGTTVDVGVRIWNETVANLTLMALGSSTPEILLSIIEICGNDFQAGDLGSSTIVGSAAYNLFMISAICVYVVPNNQSRKIKQQGVFFVTATWSLFAYIWMYVILVVISEGVVEIWEAVLTFAFFPATVLTAYIVDRQILIDMCLPNEERKESQSSQLLATPDDMKAENRHNLDQARTASILNKRINNIVSSLREQHDRNPELDLKAVQVLTEMQGVGEDHKSKAYYRHPERRSNTASIRSTRRKLSKRTSERSFRLDDSPSTKLFFEHRMYSVMENAGVVILTVMRMGGNMAMTCSVDYFTENGTASAGKGYDSKTGTLVFVPGQERLTLDIAIIDDDVFQEDQYFYVNLSNARLSDSLNIVETSVEHVRLWFPYTATVTIFDDDHPGVFNFYKSQATVEEDIECSAAIVCRDHGGKGRVKVPFKVFNGTAKRGVSFEIFGQELIFEPDEYEKYINIHILNEEKYTKNLHLKLTLEAPQLIHSEARKKTSKEKIISPEIKNDKKLVEGRTSVRHNAELNIKPKLGERTTFTMTIVESQEFKKVVHGLINSKPPVEKVPTWREQFTAAITVVASADIDDELLLPSPVDYLVHFSCLNWKILAAFMPPSNYLSGLACFASSIFLIGVQTTIIGDIAASFGCTIGMKDSLTAITFVAIGTSLPDTFASKLAAVNERYADSAIGNVTGSNAVNVFLGVGIAWTIAAIVWAFRGEMFVVPPGDLTKSVAMYSVLSVLALAILIARRHRSVGGELGGPMAIRRLTSLALVLSWVAYLVFSTLVIYCVI